MSVFLIQKRCIWSHLQTPSQTNTTIRKIVFSSSCYCYKSLLRNHLQMALFDIHPSARNAFYTFSAVLWNLRMGPNTNKHAEGSISLTNTISLICMWCHNRLNTRSLTWEAWSLHTYTFADHGLWNIFHPALNCKKTAVATTNTYIIEINEFFRRVKFIPLLCITNFRILVSDAWAIMKTYAHKMIN